VICIVTDCVDDVVNYVKSVIEY